MQGTRQPRWRGMEQQQQYGAHVHKREEEREDETGRKIGVSKREKMRRDERTMNGRRQKPRTENTAGCCWLHQAPPQGSTHSVCTAAHTAQADRFDIRKRSGWLAGVRRR